MKSAFEQALADCLARLEAGVGIEECLRGHEALAGELRPLLEAAQALRASDVAGYRPEAFQRGRARMHAARVLAAERGGRSAFAGLWRPLTLMGVGATLAVLAGLGLTTGIFRFGADTTSAQVNGVVSRVDPNAIVLITADGRVSIRIAEGTVVLDAMGNEITGGDIAPGRSARIEAEEKDGEYSAQRIEVEEEDQEGQGAEVEFSAHVQTVSGGIVTVQGSFGVATVVVDASTEVKGVLKPGAAVEVHANVQGDGSYLAKEIEVKGESSGEDGGGDAGTLSSGHGGDDSGSGSGGSSSPEPEESHSPEPDSGDD